MTKLERIEQDVASLSPEELDQFADWFAELQAALWEKKFEHDVASGKLESLAEQAIAHHKAGRTTPL